MNSSLQLLKLALGKRQFRKYKREVKRAIKHNKAKELAREAVAFAEVIGIDHHIMMGGTLELIEILEK